MVGMRREHRCGSKVRQPLAGKAPPCQRLVAGAALQRIDVPYGKRVFLDRQRLGEAMREILVRLPGMPRRQRHHHMHSLLARQHREAGKTEVDQPVEQVPRGAAYIGTVQLFVGLQIDDYPIGRFDIVAPDYPRHGIRWCRFERRRAGPRHPICVRNPQPGRPFP